MPSRVKFFSGAPLATSLDWDEEGLLNNFASSSQSLKPQHEHQDEHAAQYGVGSPLQDLTLLHEQHRRPKHRTDPEEFLEYSLAVHEGLQSSQIAPHENVEDEDTTFVTTTSFMTSFSDHSELPTEVSVSMNPPRVKQVVTFSGPITNLDAIPTVPHLLKIRPQTVTVNLIVGIINVAPTRTVQVRKGNYSMDVVEIVVGDETKAGFNISSWLVPVGSQQQQQRMDELRASLQGLQPQDIVLVQCIALSTFNGQVFGQSLNRRMTKNTTKIALLHRDGDSSMVDLEGSSLSINVSGKLQRVQDWVESFVGPGGKRKRATRTGALESKRTRYAAEEEVLPPDSP
ncbi:hypothetical protein H2203_001630 [Taxawa tesnikishii (nom. ined.)]|nr:hypothetical protein H2203_001630 [Dothideales sp. JES 119]